MRPRILHLYLNGKYQCNRTPYYDCNMNTFGFRVRELREKAKWSQEDLAKAANVSQSTIAQIEGGRNKGSKHILALAHALNVSPEWLQHGDTKGTSYAVPVIAKQLSESPEISRAARALIEAIKEADRNGTSQEAFDVLKQTLRLLGKRAPDPDEPFDVEDPGQ